MTYIKRNHVSICSDSPTVVDDLNEFGSQHEEFYDAFTNEHTPDGVHDYNLLPRGGTTVLYNSGTPNYPVAYIYGIVDLVQASSTGTTKIIFSPHASAVDKVFVSVIPAAEVGDIYSEGVGYVANADIIHTNTITVYIRDLTNTLVDIGYHLNIWIVKE